MLLLIKISYAILSGILSGISSAGGENSDPELAVEVWWRVTLMCQVQSLPPIQFILTSAAKVTCITCIYPLESWVSPPHR